MVPGETAEKRDGNAQNRRGFDGFPEPVEIALSSAAGFVRGFLDPTTYGLRQTPARGEKLAEEVSPEERSEWIKHAATLFGASRVGVCVPEREWFRPPEAIEEMGFTEQNIRAVVIAVAMDPAAFEQAPSKAVSRASTMGYMKMALVAGGVAQFIRDLGYHAVAHGNGAALSTLLGEKAGLGEVGYHCLLVSEAYGPCLRLCKVFTDMDLAPDPPGQLGVRETCATCLRCVEACPVDAIERVGEPRRLYGERTVSHYWRVDGRKCRGQWNHVGNSCGVCLAACPYMPGDRPAQRQKFPT